MSERMTARAPKVEELEDVKTAGSSSFIYTQGRLFRAATRAFPQKRSPFPDTAISKGRL